MSSYFCTVGEPRAARDSSGGVSGWRLCINYNQKSLINNSLKKIVCQSVKLARADSNHKMFCLLDLPTIFPTKEEALANQKAFHDHVEDVVRNGRPPRTLTAAALPAIAAASAMPVQLAAAQRGTCAMNIRARQRCARVKRKLQEKQVMRCVEWQQYRARPVAHLQEHIHSGNTILLLDNPPE